MKLKIFNLMKRTPDCGRMRGIAERQGLRVNARNRSDMEDWYDL